MKSSLVHTSMGIALLALVVGCGGGGDGGDSGGGSPAFTVEASDGSARIDFPKGALPAGVDPAAVRIRRIPPEDVFTVQEGPPPVGAYELLPDGVQLQAPGIITVFGSWDELGGGVWIHRVHGSEIEFVSSVQLTLHTPDLASISYAVTHFSLDYIAKVAGVVTEIPFPLEDSPWGPAPFPGVVRARAIPAQISTLELTEEIGVKVVLTPLPEVCPTSLARGDLVGGDAIAPLETPLPTVATPLPSEWTGAHMMRCTAPEDFAGLTWYCVVSYGVRRELLENGSVVHTSDHCTEVLLAKHRYIRCLAAMEAACEGDAKTGAAVDVGQSAGVPADATCEGAQDASTEVTPHPSDEVPDGGGVEETLARWAFQVTWKVFEGWYDFSFGNTTFPCGDGAYGYTVCPSMPAPGADGDYDLVSVAFDVDIPLDHATNVYEYGFVFDADGDPTNNYEAPPDYPNDYFQGTDRWYVASYDPATGWSMDVTDATDGVLTPVASAARIIIEDNAMVLVAPAGEFTVTRPKYRITAFRHTGDHGFNPPHDWDGSVWPPVADGLGDWP